MVAPAFFYRWVPGVSMMPGAVVRDGKTLHGPVNVGNPKRMVEWGNWGLTFYWKVPGEYAPTKIEGVLYFPVGTRGPMDGYLGSPERERYKAISAAWMRDGQLPEGMVAR